MNRGSFGVLLQQDDVNQNVHNQQTDVGGSPHNNNNNQRRNNQGRRDRRNPNNKRGNDRDNLERNNAGRNNTGRNGRAGSSNKNKNQGNKFHLGFKKLEELTNQTPEDVLINLTRDKQTFTKLIADDLSGDYIVLIVKLLLKICEVTYNAMKMQMLSLVLDDKFIKTVINFILNLSIADAKDKKKNSYFWHNSNEFFNNLFFICKYMLELMPNKSYDKLCKIEKAVSKTLVELEDNGTNINEDTKAIFKQYQTKLVFINEEIERKNHLQSQAREKDGNDDEFDKEPPENYRLLPIIPMANELLLNEMPFIRKNRIEGVYKDPNHYLDIQFRLLREDFIGPLRDGIQNYIQNSNKKTENIRIHNKVKFISQYNEKSTIGILLQFNFSKKFKFNENSRRLIFGSLLCFTNKDFSTMFFGKVIERNSNLLKAGMIVVDLLDSYTNCEYMKEYLMIECSIFFEPYYQVLHALQNYDEHDFPLENYILYVDRLPKMPQYYYFMGDVLHNIVIDERSCSPRNVDTWPNAEDLLLNDSQYVAYKNALTRELVVIQGPPGTGKTYLGLKIAKTLIANSKLWFKKGPMLVVCYTNHALDQFLEGIGAVTDNIIRIGGQSRNENMNKFNIRNKRIKNKNVIAKGVFYDERRSLNEILLKINKCTHFLKALNDFVGVVCIEKIHVLDPNIKGTSLEKVSKMNLGEWLTNRRNINGVENVEWFLEEGNISEEEEETDDSDMENVIDLDDNIFGDYIPTNPYCINLMAITSDMNEKGNRLSQILPETFERDLEVQLEYYKILNELEDRKALYEDLKENLDYGKRNLFQQKPQGWRRFNLENMPKQMRWHFYFYWLNLYRNALKKKLEGHYRVHKECLKRYNEARDIIDLGIMKASVVIGMTTTGAARMQATLRALKSPIVIVEEAAEVLESHVIVCLSKQCNQLILIGDHQQLRPSTSNYNLERNYQLGISMFERMIINKMHCDSLNVQHRMRPEISALISPSIYENLQNSVTVYGYPKVNGVTKPLYFIHHTNPESNEADTTSRKNVFEADYLLRLARYLVLNGYNAEDITIIAAYSAQMFYMRNERRIHSIIKGTKITVLDNYQGEENKIILLSLVRNNTSKSIGFLSIENRVCVALSRAKEGMYVMGNMDLLCSYSSIWPKIKEVLLKQDSYGISLELYCKDHQVTTNVEYVRDFEQVPEGGCNKLCAEILICGHVCKKICHAYDKDHKEYVCTEICNKILCDLNHPCPKMCGEKCGPCKTIVTRMLPCGHEANMMCFIEVENYKCLTKMKRNLPCDHEVYVPCHKDPATYKCPEKCDSRVEPCGHSCTLTCHKFQDPDHLKYLCNKDCEKVRIGCKEGNHICRQRCHRECEPCTVNVKRQRTFCPHVYNVSCMEDVDVFDCEKPCTKNMECGHRCKNKCFEDCGPCKAKVFKVGEICGHKMQVLCYQQPDRKLCNKKCPLPLPCGHKCQNNCNQPCTTKCQVLVTNELKAPCGHQFKTPCSYQNKNLNDRYDVAEILKYCTAPCYEVLKCKHKCSGTCGDCHQGKVHLPCQEKCGVVLPCGHECTAPCREACRPCQKKCAYKCVHSKCTKKCGEPCTSCKENCPRQCPHVKCKKRCGEICDVPACTEPCEKVLKCGHPCIGFCGDKCPPLCRICNPDKLTEFFMGYEDEEDSRFVYLEECGHTIESQGMEQWLSVENEGNESKEIKAAYCPRCKTTITFTERYSNYVKQTCANLSLIKHKIHGDLKKIEKLRIKTVEKYLRVASLYSTIISKDKNLMLLSKYIKELSGTVTKNFKRQNMDKMKIDTLNAKIDLMEEILKIINECEVENLKATQYSQWFLKYFAALLMRNDNVIMQQETLDINMEISKYHRIMQYLLIEKSLNAYQSATKDISNIIEIFDNLLNSFDKYTDKSDMLYKEYLIKLKKLSSSGLNISDREKKEIVSAMGLSPGHWYKCPNGHVYIITECGGAMQISKCSECGVTIGGTNHALTSGNSLAPEMDGARFSAWSTQANMLNYNLHDL